MIYEVRTYTTKCGAVPDFESHFEKDRLPILKKYLKLAAFWHTEIGPLNQAVIIWAFDDLNDRQTRREALGKDADMKKLGGTPLILKQQSELMIPAPFMKPLGSRTFGEGNVYELRTYAFQPFSMPQVLERWGQSMPFREKFSPLVAGMYTDMGDLNQFVHIWVYKDLNERECIRNECRAPGQWPPGTREWMLSQESKIILPAAFSPLK